MNYFDSSYSLLVIGILAIIAECLLVVPKRLNLFLVGIVLIITGAIGILLHSFIIAFIIASVVLFNLHFIFRAIYSPYDSKSNNKLFKKKELPLALSSIINKVPFVYRIFLLAILASIFFLRGSFFHPEAYYFLRQFQEDKPFLVRIFDQALEFNNPFQAREFSYIIDFIDGQFLIRSARLGIVHFYSLSHYIGIFTIASLAFIMSKRYFRQKFLDISILISLLYLTTPPVFIHSNLYRSSKILVAFFIVFIMYLLFHYAAKKIISKKHLLLFTIFAFLMATSDKQGIFFVSAFATALGIIFLLDRTWKSFLPVICFVIAGTVYSFYSSTVGPWLIYFFNNESVQFTKDSSIISSYLPAAISYRTQVIEYFSYQFSYFFGNLGIFFGAFVAIAMLFSFLYLFVRIWFKKDEREHYCEPLVRKLTLAIPILLLLSTILIAMMLHYSLLFLTAPDLRLTYYNLPIIALILLLSQIVFAQVLIIWPDKKKLIKGALIVFLVLNAISILKHFDVYKEGFIKQGALAAPVLKECIKQKDEPQKNFGLASISQHADEVCVFLRKRIESNHVLCKDSPAYKCLSKIDGEEFENFKSEQAQKSKPAEILYNPFGNNIAFALLRNNLQNKNYLGDTEIKLGNSVYHISMSSISQDNFLYKVIIVRDKIVERLLTGQINKIKYELLMANRLIYSSLLLADKGNISLAKEFALKGENHFTILTYYWYGDNIPKELIKEVKDYAIMHRAILSTIINKVKKEEDKAVFKQVFDFSVRNEKQLDVLMKKNKST